jgi:hypothetical protein
MSTKQLLALFAALLAFASSTSAQSDDIKECPHQRVVNKSAEFTVVSTVECGTNLSINIGGVQFETRPGRCPLLIDYIPPRTITERADGSHTYTLPRNTWRAMAFQYRCNAHWLFGFIPIDVSTTCDPAGSHVTSTGSNYDQYPCRQ